MYKQKNVHNVAINENWGSPQISHPAFLVLSSHALCALGRFLICFQGNRLYLWFFFFARVCCSLIACRLRFAWTWTDFSSKIFTDFLAGSELFSVLRATMWLQVEELATTEFLLVEKVYVAFSNISRVIPLSQRTNQKLWCVFRWPSTHERPYVGVKISNIRSSVSRCSRWKYFFCVCWKMILWESVMLDVFGK